MTILPGKEEMEWMTEWHYQVTWCSHAITKNTFNLRFCIHYRLYSMLAYMQEVIQLAYATLQNIFEKEKQGISFGHKYSHTLMKGVFFDVKQLIARKIYLFFSHAILFLHIFKWM